jgi:hypothetical protein
MRFPLGFVSAHQNLSAPAPDPSGIPFIFLLARVLCPLDFELVFLAFGASVFKALIFHLPFLFLPLRAPVKESFSCFLFQLLVFMPFKPRVLVSILLRAS